MNFAYAFIISYGRSGSTLLQGILNGIPGVLIRGENHNALYQLYRAYECADLAYREFGAPGTDARYPWFGADKIDRRVFLEDLRRSFVANVLAPPPGARLLGFKEIRYSPLDIPESRFVPYLDFMRTAFPRAALIFNTRRVDDTAGSGWWRDNPTAHSNLAETERRFRDYLTPARKDCFHMRYEEYADNPDALRPLFDFLGAPFDGEQVKRTMARPHSVKEVVPS
jgi:hypothetical protein